MKLSSMVIYERISEHYEAYFLTCADTEYGYSRPKIYIPGSFLEQGQFYIARAEELPVLSKDWAGANVCVICLGKIPDKARKFSINLIEIQRYSSREQVFNQVLEIYEIYDSYERELNKSILEQTGFQTAVSVFERMFGNPLAIVDMDFHYLAKSENLGKTKETVELLEDERGNMSLDIVNSVKFDPVFNQVSKCRKAFLYVNNILNISLNLCLNIWYGKKQAARVLVFQVNRPFTEGDYYLMDACSRWIHLLYEQFVFSNESDRLSLSHLLIQMLDGYQVSAYMLEQAVRNHSFSVNDTYILYYIQLSEDDRRSKTAGYLCRNFMTRFSDAVAFEYKDNIVLLLDLSLTEGKDRKNKKIDVQQLESKLTYIFRDSILKTGRSRKFRDIYKIYEYYMQACAALEIGCKIQPTIWHHDFEEYAFIYLLEKCISSAPMETLCDSGVLKLREYDRKHHTSYSETLKAFFLYRFNATHAARALYIHRTTFIERMERIKHILKNDLNDNDQCLHMMISYKLLEIKEKNL